MVAESLPGGGGRDAVTDTVSAGAPLWPANRPDTSSIATLAANARVVPGTDEGAGSAGLTPRSRLTSREHGVQALALDVLHGVVVHPVVLADAEDRHDVGVVEHGRGAGLALEPLELVGVAQAVLRQDLERHVPAQALLHRLVDDAHAAAGDLPQDAVVAQPLGDRPRGPRPRRSRPGRLVGPAAELFDRDQGREQLVDLLGELWVFLGVLAQGRPLAAAVPLGKLVGKHVEQVGSRGRIAHGDQTAQEHQNGTGNRIFFLLLPHASYQGDSWIFQRFLIFIVRSGAGCADRGVWTQAKSAQTSLGERSCAAGRWLRH